ncbi:MAG: hypothetical protein ACE5FL_08210 [Myxococcota bacterium]
MSSLRRAAESLLAVAGDLDAALDRGDDVALATALTRRERAFAELRAAVDGPAPPAVRALLRRVAALDASTLARAESLRESVRRQLGELRHARTAARALVPESDAPRFVSRRA